MKPNILDGTYKHIAAGRSIIPVNAEKRPCVSEWSSYRLEPADSKKLREWFPKHKRLAVIAGAVSGNVEAIDFDNAGRDIEEIFQNWCDLVEGEIPELFDRLSIIRTPLGGFYVLYSCKQITIPGNQHFARYKNGNDDNGRDKVLTLIESRGSGGYYVTVPSTGYERMQGDPLQSARGIR